MSQDTDTRRVSARMPDDLHDDLETLVDDGDAHSKSVVIREGVRAEVDRRMGRDVDSGDVGAVLDRLDDLDDELKRTIRGELSRVASRDRSGRGR